MIDLVRRRYSMLYILVHLMVASIVQIKGYLFLRLHACW
jgi:hypothetical protein